MAKGYYQTMYERLFGNSGIASKYYKNVDKASTAYKISKLQKEIDNKKTRMDAAGASSDTDSRNALEKFLGLPEDQNVIFDIFELIGRPQQAIFGAIDAAQKGEDAWEGAKQGFSGEKYTYGGELLRNAGIGNDDVEAELFKPSTWGIDDVLGLGLDIFADPADLIPVAGFAKASKVKKAGGTLYDAYKATDSATDLLFKGAGKAVKGAGKLADTGIEKGLKHIDSTKGIKYMTPNAKDAANLSKYTINELGQKVATESRGLLEDYKSIKNTITSAFKKNAKLTDNTVNAIRKTDGDTVRATKELEHLYNNAADKIKDYAVKIAREEGNETPERIAQIMDEIDVNLALLKEAKNLDRTVTGSQLVKEAKSGTLAYKAIGDEGIDLLNRIAEPVNKADRGLNLTVKVSDDGVVRLSKDWDKIDDLNLNLDDELLKSKLTKGTNYKKGDLDKIDELTELYSKDADFKKLYDETDEIFNEFNKVVNKNFNVNLPTDASNLGYVRHAYNKELFGNKEVYNFANNSSDFIGNKRILGDRKWNMSAREANNLFEDIMTKSKDDLSDAGKDFVENMKNRGIFKEGMMASMDSYLNDIPYLAKNNNVLNEVLVNSTFKDYKRLKEIDDEIVSARRAAHKAGIADGMSDRVKELLVEKTEMLNNTNMKLLTDLDNTVPQGFTKLNKHTSNQLLDKIKKINDEFGTGEFNEIINEIRKNGDKIAINKDILRLVDITVDEKGAKGLARLYDGLMNGFKKFKVLSPTFQMNNIVGNMSNMYLAGISPTAMARLYPEAYEIMLKSKKLMDDAAKGIKLSASDQKMLNIWYEFIDAGFGDAGKLTAAELADLPEGLKRYFVEGKVPKGFNMVKDGLPYINAKMNNSMDTASRLVTFMYGKNNPGFLSKLDVADAGAAVRKVNFDPSDLTDIEKTWMKRIMPFYTFTKKNLAFQLDNLTKNGTNYHKLLKAYEMNMDSTLGENKENVPEWLENNLYLVYPGLTKDGKYTVLRTQLPLGNLIETVDDPLSSLVGMTAPWIKAGPEILANKNLFTGNEIQNFKGEKSQNIPGLTRMQEYLLGTFSGLDVPAKSIARIAQGDNLLDGLLNTGTMERDIEVDKLNEMYEELSELETMMNQYKQMGYEFSTINELKKANVNTTINNITARLDKFKGIKQNPYKYLK